MARCDAHQKQQVVGGSDRIESHRRFLDTGLEGIQRLGAQDVLCLRRGEERVEARGCYDRLGLVGLPSAVAEAASHRAVRPKTPAMGSAGPTR